MVLRALMNVMIQVEDLLDGCYRVKLAEERLYLES